MSKSIKINYVFSLVNNITSIIFPLIAFPYASRILMADGIGQINFFQSIIQYVLLLSSLGIPMYAIREVAKVRDNIQERNKVTLEIIILHTFLSLLGYLTVAFIAITVSKISVDIPLFLLLSTSIIFTVIGCEWFYQGVEDFKYITIRGLFVKTISIILLFVFVKTKDDLLLYAGYTVFGVVGGNVFNFIRLRSYLKISTFKIVELKPFRHFKPALHIFFMNLIISVYINLNTVMLGFLKNTESVGLFTAATKLTHLTLGIVSSLGTVLLPRLTNLISNNKIEEFNVLSQKSISFVLMLTLPLSIGLIILSPYIIPLFSGNSYNEAIPTLTILAPIIILIGISNVLGIQILFPRGKEKIVIVCTTFGAIVNFVVNLWLIPLYAQNGAAIATLFAEIIVTVSMLFLGRSYFSFQWDRSFGVYIVASIIMGLVVYGITSLNLNDLELLVLSILVGSMIYSSFLIFTKDPFYMLIKSFLLKGKKLNSL